MSVEEKSDFEQRTELIQNKILEAIRVRYSKKVIEEANNPKNVGRMMQPDGFGIITGPCGDTMEIYLKVSDGRITKIMFMTDGCGPTIACGSVVTSLANGKTLDDADKIEEKELIDVLDGLPEYNLHCATLAINTLHEATRGVKE